MHVPRPIEFLQDGAEERIPLGSSKTPPLPTHQKSHFHATQLAQKGQSTETMPYNEAGWFLRVITVPPKSPVCNHKEAEPVNGEPVVTTPKQELPPHSHMSVHLGPRPIPLQSHIQKQKHDEEPSGLPPVPR